MRLGRLSYFLVCSVALAWAPVTNAANIFTDDSVVQIAIHPLDTAPATDLVYEGTSGPRILNVLEAREKQKWDPEKKEKLDLSTLEPRRDSEYYDGVDHSADRTLDDSLSVQDGEEITYVENLLTADGRIRFMARNARGTPYHFLLSPTLHTMLLRKELLRKLGYFIPAMKWLSHVKIRFPSKQAKELFYASIGRATNFATSHWDVTPSDSADPLLVDFQDVVAIESGSSPNLAFGPPIETSRDERDPKIIQILPLRERIFRALSIPYGIVDLKKSVNQLSWNLGGTQSRFITFDVSVIANFSTGMDDALWIFRKIARLTRSDIRSIVKGAHFPQPIEDLMVEKIISRTLALGELPGLKQVKIALKPEYHIQSLPGVENGKVTQQDWPGYATPFASQDQPSPLKGVKYYILSQIENGAIQALLNLANKEIPSLTQEEAFQKHSNEILQKAFLEWQQTGQVQAPSFKIWSAPLVNGGISLSRGPVIGSYMGTNNLVSLADSFGVSANVGLAINTDGVPQGTQLGGIIQGSISLNITHVKQLFGLKQILQEPIRNEFVPYVLLRASKLFRKLSERKDELTTVSPEQLEAEIIGDFDKIRKMIGVGDSLILSLNVGGLEKISGGIGLPDGLGPNASLGLSANQAAIWRLHLHRKDEDTLQVFQDQGAFNSFAVSLDANLSRPAQMPVLSLNFKTTRGKAATHIFTVNISKNPTENPKLFETAVALSQALKTGSLALLKDLQTPAMVKNVFRDRSGSFRILHHVNRKLVTRTEVKVTLPDQSSGDYLSLNFGRQRGRDFQKIATDAANFLIQLLTNQTQYNLNAFTSNAPNPGNTFYGSSYTRNANFQAELGSSELYDPFVKITYTWQGFEKSAEKARALVHELSQRYGYPLYSEESLRDFKKIQLYQIGLSINIYENGLKNLSSLTPWQINLILKKYRKKHHCAFGLSVPCAATRRFAHAFRRLHRTKISLAKHAEALFMMAQSLEEFSDFNDFLSLIGGDQNLRIIPRISGYWTESEIKAVTPPPAQTFGYGTSPFDEGVLSSVEQILNVDDGEFYSQWLREVL